MNTDRVFIIAITAFVVLGLGLGFLPVNVMAQGITEIIDNDFRMGLEIFDAPTATDFDDEVLVFDRTLTAVEVDILYSINQSMAGPFPAEFELSSLAAGDGSTGFVLNGIDEFDLSGVSVSSAGDVNGDGVDDIIIGAVGADFTGESYVVFGRDTAQAGNFPAEFELSSLAVGDGSAGFVLNGAFFDSGGSVSSAGDVNGDGMDDVIVGFPSWDIFGDGKSHVVFGRDTAQAGNFPAEFELSNLAAGDGSNGFVLNGTGLSGSSVSLAGDVNGDGVGDVIIGAAFSLSNYVVFGRDTAQAGNFPAEFELSSLAAGDGSAGFVLVLQSFSGGITTVSAAGDVNGDGLDDVLIGDALAFPGDQSFAGESYVVFGRDTAQAGNFPAEFELSSLAVGDGSTGFVLNSIEAGDQLGQSVSGAGDLNGDGLDDVIVGAIGADDFAGANYVVFGRDTAQAGNFPAEFELSSLAAGDGSAGFVLTSIDADFQTGYSVSSAGDVNGDGMDDVIVGGFSDAQFAGESYLVFGRDTAQAGNFPAVFELSSLAAGDGSAGFVLNGIDEFDESGFSASSAGDVNGDGVDDLIIGATYADPDARTFAGESYVVFGRADKDNDGDSIFDAVDNCTLVANPSQTDTNSDGIGNRCDPDIAPAANNDCVVDFIDVGDFKAAFLTTPVSPNWNPDADFDGDDFVGFLDLGIMKSFFLAAPGPSANGCN